jgi:MFS family permease
MRDRRAALRHNRGFMLLFAGQSISVLGSDITTWALPLTAVLTLGASPTQMGLLSAAGALPILLAGPVAGAWTDRVRRKPLLIFADLGRVLILASIPLAAVLGHLSLGQLYAAVILAGALSITFDVAYQALLPALVGRDSLVEANSAMEASASVARIAGSGLAGVLVQLLSGPTAILTDAFSFLVSAASLSLIDAAEPEPPSVTDRRRVRQEIAEGLRALADLPVVRALTIASGIFNLFDSALIAVYVLYLIRTLSIPAGLVGLVFALGGVGGLLGALLAGPVARKYGMPLTLMCSAMIAGIAELGIAVAGGPLVLAISIVVAGEGLVQVSASIYGINAQSLRQSLVPDYLQGRVAATTQIIRQGVIPIGALIGGICADHFGLRPTVVAAGLGTLSSGIWLALSPVRTMQ